MSKKGFESELARKIVSYYLRNPEAADTLEGIARWRLMEEEIHHAVTRVQEALKWLVESGLLIRTTNAASPPLFSLNRHKRAEATQFLLGRRAGTGKQDTSKRDS
ncbi:MAG: hypothetical protein EHM61_15450 [Acidobacteria bacterium]|nr:MAG: hypothetical protein EHM61_15450 [Acidobacteriota bacterium]